MPPINPLKILNLAPFADSRSATMTWLQRLQGALQYGWRWFWEYPAQERLAQLLAEHLDRRFLLVLNLAWPNVQGPFPPILLGPSGIHLLMPTLLRGEFRVREDRLWVYDTRKQRFKPHKPDLVQELLQYRQRLEDFLNRHLSSPIAVEARLVFLHPSTYVDALQAQVAPLMVDGLARYLDQLSHQRKYQRQHIQQWLELLQSQKEASTVAEAPVRESPRATPRPRPTAHRTAARSRRAALARKGPRSRKRGPLGFTRQQWIVLGVLAALNILLLVITLALILMTS